MYYPLSETFLHTRFEPVARSLPLWALAPLLSCLFLRKTVIPSRRHRTQNTTLTLRLSSLVRGFLQLGPFQNLPHQLGVLLRAGVA